MTIICTSLDHSTGLQKHYFMNLAKFSIDPNSVHETSLPGNHKNYFCVLDKGCAKWINHMHNFKIRPDDIWIVGIPKTGTTWMHNIAYKMKNGLNSESIASALENQHFERGANSTKQNFLERLQYFDNLASPRIFKTHLPAFLLPKEIWTVKAKIIYTARNPKDTALSGYHMMRNSIVSFKGTVDDYSNGIMCNVENCMPFFDHIRGYLQLRHLDHVLFTVYEEFVVNQFEGIRSVSDFLECSHSHDQLLRLLENVSFKKMQNEFPSFLAPGDNNVPDPSYK